jgi:monoamine oxidase
MLAQALASARRLNLAAAGEPMPTPGADGQTRRAVLKALGATGLAAALSHLPRPARAGPVTGPVAIIGGGIAGLTALWQLTEAGIDARVYEARSRLGGRMFTHRPGNGGVTTEVGGQLVNSDHADMHRLVKAFGLELIDRKSSDHRTILLADGSVLASDVLVQALRPIVAQIGTDSDRLDRNYAAVARELDRLSIRDYLDAHAALLPQPWVRRLMEATSRTEYGVEPDRASAIELIFNLPTVEGERIDVLGRSDERFVIAGGSGALIDAMTARFASRIETGKRLLRIEPHGAGMKLGFLDGSVAPAGAVVVATPAPLLRQIDFRVPLPPLWRHFIAEVDLGFNEKLQVGTTARAWEGPIGRGGELWQTDAGAGAALGWDGSVRMADGDDNVWTWFLGGEEVAAADTVDPAELARRLAAMAEAAMPGFASAATGFTRRTNWRRDPLTLGAYVNFRPGQLTRFGELVYVEGEAGPRHHALAGRLQFAGEHLSDAYPGYMNGGAQTGRLAAEAIRAAHVRAA